MKDYNIKNQLKSFGQDNIQRRFHDQKQEIINQLMQEKKEKETIEQLMKVLNMKIPNDLTKEIENLFKKISNLKGEK